MPFYRTFFAIHKKVGSEDLRVLLDEVRKSIIKGSGGVFEFQDYGWRHSGYMVRKAGVGQFHTMRWFTMLWGSHPATVAEVGNLFRSHSGVLRFLTLKNHTSPRRSSFYSVQKYPVETRLPPEMHST